MEDVLLSPIRISDLSDMIEQAVHNALRSYTPENMTKDMLTINEACAFTGYKKSTIYGLVSRREIPHSKKGKNLYFSRRELDEYMREGKRKTRTEIAIDADRRLSSIRRK